MTSMRRRVTAVGVALFFAACGGHAKVAVSANAASADTDDDGPDPTPAGTSAASTSTASTSTGATSTPVAAIAPAPTVASIAPPANCPIACAMLGPAGRALEADDQATLRTALAPTVASLHGCMGDTGGRYVRAPAIVARFAESGELLDMGVDSNGWGQGEQACFDGVVHGGTEPQFAMQGRATVRCSETCGARHGRGGGSDEPSYSNHVLQGASPAPSATQAPRMRMGGGRGGGRGGGGRSGGRSGGGGTQ
jgi:hypothetical protein